MASSHQTSTNRKQQVRRDWTEVEKVERVLLAKVKQEWLCDLLEIHTGAQAAPSVILMAPHS